MASVALGARFTLVGRAYLYGLMAGGEAGVDRAIQILSEQVVRTMRLLGVNSLEELEPRHVTQLARHGPGPAPARARHGHGHAHGHGHGHATPTLPVPVEFPRHSWATRPEPGNSARRMTSAGFGPPTS